MALVPLFAPCLGVARGAPAPASRPPRAPALALEGALLRPGAARRLRPSCSRASERPPGRSARVGRHLFGFGRPAPPPPPPPTASEKLALALLAWVDSTLDFLIGLPSWIRTEWQQQRFAFILGIFLVGSVVGFIVGRYRPIRTALDITPRDVQQRRRLGCFVVSVPHADTLFLRHRPLWTFWSPMPTMRRLTEEAICVSLEGVYSPSAESCGSEAEAEPFGIEAKDFVEARLLHKRCRIRLLSRDTAGRIVASVSYGWWPFVRTLSARLLQHGLAIYARRKQTLSSEHVRYFGVWPFRRNFSELEALAKKRKVGLWSQDKVVMPQSRSTSPDAAACC